MALRVPPTLLVIGSITSVQVGSSLAKGAFEFASPVALAWMRLLFAALALIVLAPPRLSGRKASEWLSVLGYAVAMVGMNLTFYLAIQRIPVGVAVTVEFLGPLVVALVGVRHIQDVIWAVLAFCGVALLGFTPGSLDVIGVVLAGVAGAFWALYIVLAVPTGRYWSGITGVTVAAWVGGIGLAIPAVWSSLEDGWMGTAQAWGLGLVLATMSSVIPYGLEMVALRRIKPSVFGILMSLEPAAAALFAFFIVRETLYPLELVAMACVIIASMGVTRANHRRRTN